MFSCCRILLLITPLLVAFKVAAQPTITLQPSTCVVKKGDSCQAKVAVSVKKVKYGKDVCLLAPTIRFKACQMVTRQTVFHVAIDTKSSINFVLIDATSNSQLTSAQLEIAIFEPVATRKRRSFAWSFHRDSE